MQKQVPQFVDLGHFSAMAKYHVPMQDLMSRALQVTGIISDVDIFVQLLGVHFDYNVFVPTINTPFDYRQCV